MRRQQVGFRPSSAHRGVASAEEPLRTPFHTLGLLNSDLIEALGVAVYTTDATGRITQYNEAAVELWGRRPELGKDLWCGSLDLYHPGGTPLRHDKCPMAITLKENRPVRGEEAVALRPDGTRVHFMPFPTPLRDSSGNLIGAVNVLVDVTDRKQAEAERIQSEQAQHRLQTDLARRLVEEQAINQISGLLRTAMDLQTVCEAALSAATSLTGTEFGMIAARKEDMARLVASRGFKRRDLLPYRRMDASTPSLLAMALFKGQAAFSPKKRLPSKTAGNFATHGINRFAVMPLVAHGSIVGAFQVCSRDTGRWSRDQRRFLMRIADQVAMAISSSLQYEQLEEAFRLRDEGVRAIAHEVRTPLTAIKGFAQLAIRQLDRDGYKEEDLRDSLQEVNIAAERLTKLAVHMLSASSIEQSLSRIQKEECMIGSVLRDAIREFTQQDLSTKVRLQRVPRIKLQCDPQLIRQVVWNLLSNAVRHSPPGGEVVVKVCKEQGQATICVSDSGPGVPPREQKRLFEKFHRGRSGDKCREHQGLGLGLYLAKQVIEAHSGKVWYQTAEPTGATFCFSLPLDGGRKNDR